MVEHLFFHLKHQHFIHHQSNSGRARLHVINRHNFRQTIFWDDQMKGWWNDNCFSVRSILGTVFRFTWQVTKGGTYGRLAGCQCQISGSFSFKQVGFKSFIIAAVFHSNHFSSIVSSHRPLPSFVLWIDFGDCRILWLSIWRYWTHAFVIEKGNFYPQSK